MESGQELLEENLKLTKENNKILLGLRRSQRLGIAFTAFKWIIVISLTLGAYYYLQPFLEQLLQIYSGLGDVYNSTGSLFDGFRLDLDRLQ